MSGQLNALAALAPLKETLYLLHRNLDRIQSHLKRYEEENLIDLAGIRNLAYYPMRKIIFNCLVYGDVGEECHLLGCYAV
jgi:hypothetical protein